MCDTYVDDVGYVCNECQKEFKEFLEYSNIEPKTEGEIRDELKIFMDTTKRDTSLNREMSVDEFFKEHSK
jgi:hypothetical protein